VFLDPRHHRCQPFVPGVLDKALSIKLELEAPHLGFDFVVQGGK